MPRFLKIGLSLGYCQWLWVVLCRFVGFHVKVITDENNTIKIKVIKWKKIH